MKKIYKKKFLQRLLANTYICFLSIFLFLFEQNAYAQTNPIAFNLAGGNFTFTSQTASSTVYPTNIQGWNNTGVANIATEPISTSTADIVLIANGTASTAGISNLGTNGFQFLTTAAVNTVGALVISLNSTGRTSILITWTAADQTPAASSREMKLTLQYRVGTTGSFTAISGSTYTTFNTGLQAAQTFTNVLLPAACDNQAIIQLRWIYYESAAQSGSRDAIRLDNIIISSSSTFIPANGDYRPAYSGSDFSFSNGWEVYSGTWGPAGINTPQNLPSGSKPPRIIIDKLSVTGGGSASNKYNDIIILSGGELILTDNDPPPVFSEFIDANKRIEVQAGGILRIQGDIDLPVTGNLILRSGSTMDLDQNTLVNNHPLWDGIELFEGGSTVVLKNWDWAASPTTRSLLNVSTAINNNANGYKFGNFIFAANPTITFTIVGGGIGVVNLCENNLDITNASTFFIGGATNQTGTNGFVVNGDMNILNGPFSFGSTFNTGNYDHQFIIRGNFSCISNDALKIHHNGLGTPTTLSGNVTFNGNVTVGSSISAFSNDVGSGSPNRMVVNFNGGSSLSPLDIDIFPTATAMSMNVMSGAFVRLKSQDLILNSITSNTAIFSVKNGGTLHFGWNSAGTVPLVIKKVNVAPAGTNQFVTDPNSTLLITSADGIQQASATSGNVQMTTGNKTYNQLATFNYIGKTNQFTGDGLTGSTGNGRVVICDLIDNTKQLTLTSSFALTNSTIISPTGGKLDIRQGQVLETNTAFVSGSNGTLYMSGGTLYKIAKGNNATGTSISDPIPRVSGTFAFPYILSGGTIELSGTGASDAFQTIRGGSYKYIKFSGANTLGVDYKNLTSTVTIDSGLVVSETAIVDCISVANNPFSFTGNGGINMTGGRIRFLNRTITQPELAGIATVYSLTGGVIEFYASSPGSNQTIQGKYGSPTVDIQYNQIEITGNTVANGAANITLRQGGIFTVKSTGIFEINEVAIDGPGTAESVIVEGGGVFRCVNALGFNGPVIGLNSPSVRNNIETITLNPTSTVEYYRANPPLMSIADQVITNTIAYKNLIIAGTGIKTAPSGTLIVQENLTKSGTSTFANSNGTVLMSGVAANYTFAGLPFYQLQLAGGTKITNGNSSIQDNLTIATNTNLSITNDNTITLLSSNTRTARVGQFAGSTAISYGNAGSKFIVERYIKTPRKWQLLSVPTSNAAQTVKTAWAEGQAANVTGTSGFGTHITGPNGAPNLDFTSPLYSLKYWDPSLGTAGGFAFVTTRDTALANPAGFYIYVRGDRNVRIPEPGNNTVLRTSGQLFVGNPSVSLPQSSKFYSIGNPLASAIDLRLLSYSPASLNPATKIYLWDPSLSGAYTAGAYQTLTYHTPSSSFKITPGASGSSVYPASGLDHNTVQSGQAFFIQTPNTAISFPEASKVAVNTITPTFGPDEWKAIRANLFTDNGAEEILVDGIAADITNEFSNAADINDADKFGNSHESISFVRDGIKMSVERHAMINAEDTFYIRTENLRQRNYKWKLDLTQLNVAELIPYLKDSYKNNETILNDGLVNIVNFSVNGEAASYSPNRFIITFKQVPVTKFISLTASRNTDRSIAINYKVANENQVQQYEIERSSDGINFVSILNNYPTNNGSINSYSRNDANPQNGENFYRIKASFTDGRELYSAIAKVESGIFKNSISVYPNPVEGRQVQIQFSNQPAGSYNMQLSDPLGQIIYQQKIMVSNTQFRQTIVLENYMAAGTYQLLVMAADGAKTIVPVIIN